MRTWVEINTKNILHNLKSFRRLIGKKKLLNPEERLHRLESLNRDMYKLSPYKKPKGVVIKFKTYEELYKFILSRASKKI